MIRMILINALLILTNNIFAQFHISGGNMEFDYCQNSIALSNDSFFCLNTCCDFPFIVECEKLVGSVHVDSIRGFAQNLNLVMYGKTSLVLRATEPKIFGSISLPLACPLKKGQTYFLNIPLLNIYSRSNGITYVDSTKQLCIWANSDSCTKSEILWVSPNLDTAWSTYKAIITPFSQNSNYLYLRQLKGGPRFGGPYVSSYYNIHIDSLSDIYPLDAGMVQAMAKDTAVGVGKCLTLRATPQISTYDTVLWYQHIGTSLLPVGMGWSVPVCPTAHSTYIVAMRDSVPDCAGIWWSYDTVRVWIDTTIDIGIAEAPRTCLGISLYPNPAQRSIQIEMLLDRSYIRETATLTLYDMLGRAVYSTTFYNEQDIELPPLPEAMYTAEVRLDTHYWRGKLWVRE